MYLGTFGSFKSTNYKKDWPCKVPHLQSVRISAKSFKSANLQICYLQNLFADRFPLSICKHIVS
jgi:hypothetical protein